MDLIKPTRFCTTKETINKTKRQHTEWEKIFENDETDKGSISKIHRQLIQFNNNKPNNLTEKSAEDIVIFQRIHIDGQHTHMKKCLTLLIIREMPSKLK